MLEVIKSDLQAPTSKQHERSYVAPRPLLEKRRNPAVNPLIERRSRRDKMSSGSDRQTQRQSSSEEVAEATTPNKIDEDILDLRNQTQGDLLDEAFRVSKRRKSSSYGEDSKAGQNCFPARTIDKEQEDEIIKKLEEEQRQLLEKNPMKELNEALMDRTTASQNRKKKMQTLCRYKDSDDLGQENSDLHSCKSSRKAKSGKHSPKGKRLAKAQAKARRKCSEAASSVCSSEQQEALQRYTASLQENVQYLEKQHNEYLNYMLLQPQCVSNKQEWIQSKSSYNLELMNYLLNPLPTEFTSQENSSFSRLTMKLVSLSNFLNMTHAAPSLLLMQNQQQQAQISH